MRAAALLLATFLTSTTLGAVFYLAARTDAQTSLSPLLTLSTVRGVWSDWQTLRLGLLFSIPLLTILLAHELGHYLACRYYGIAASLPYFIPGPAYIGTFGAFIRVQQRIRRKQELFDVGVAGPLAGFVVLLPFLVVGMAWSLPAYAPLTEDVSQASSALLVPGRNLAIYLTAWLFHGRAAASGLLDLHPFALAAWVGLLATAMNLMPIGQLDGGHLLYAATGRRFALYSRLAWLVLVGLGWIWPGWWFWSLLLLVIGTKHPPVGDETEPLGRARTWILWLALIVLLLSFLPVPLEQFWIGDAGGLRV